LKRRIYFNPGPNYAWHCDGNDKLNRSAFLFMGTLMAGAEKSYGCMS
jgi:hypothetical protein